MEIEIKKEKIIGQNVTEETSEKPGWKLPKTRQAKKTKSETALEIQYTKCADGCVL